MSFARQHSAAVWHGEQVLCLRLCLGGQRDGPWKEIAVKFASRANKVRTDEPDEHPGGWYPDPYGTAARRWFDNVSGWSDRVQGAGQVPDKTGVARVDEAAVNVGSTRTLDADGKPVPLARPVDPQYLASARPVL